MIKAFLGLWGRKIGLAGVYRIYWSRKRLASEKPVRRLSHQSHHTASARMSLVVLRMQKKWTRRILQSKNGKLFKNNL